MTKNFNCKYLLGIYYSCQKCLYCFQSPQQNSCKCEKTKQPLRVKNPKHKQQIYQHSYIPDPSFQDQMSIYSMLISSLIITITLKNHFLTPFVVLATARFNG